MTSRKIHALTKKAQNQKKEIASLKKKTSEEVPGSESDEPAIDAGNSLGGRAGKATCF